MRSLSGALFALRGSVRIQKTAISARQRGQKTVIPRSFPAKDLPDTIVIATASPRLKSVVEASQIEHSNVILMTARGE